MSGKVVLHYFDGRGRMESIRWLLTVAEVEVSKSLTCYGDAGRFGDFKACLIIHTA